MQVLLTLITIGLIISIVLLIPSIILIFRSKSRAKAKRVAKFSAVGLVVCFIAGLVVSAHTPNAPETTQNTVTPQKNAENIPVTTSPQEEKNKNIDINKINNDKALAAAKRPGRARICYFGNELKNNKYEEVVIPSTSTFNGLSVDSIKSITNDSIIIAKDTTSDKNNDDNGDFFSQDIITKSNITLTKESPCADVDVDLYVSSSSDMDHWNASEKTLFEIGGVINYPIPDKKPQVELGTLVDKKSVKAALLTDVSEVIHAPPPPDDATKARECLQTAANIANYMGVSIANQSSSEIVIAQTIKDFSVNVGCPSLVNALPYLQVKWEKHIRPSPEMAEFTGKAGGYLIGAPTEEVVQEIGACIEKARKPAVSGTVTLEFRGAEIGCNISADSGGGGIVTLHRRFGAEPNHTPVPLTADQIAFNPILSPPDHEACKTDWRRCADNTELFENYREISQIRGACKTEAENRARFGTPEWPWMPFSTYRVIPTARMTRGIVWLAENNAKFSNQFGAMEKVTIECKYDLETRSIKDISITE
jgi:hypothetical protein